MSVIDIYKLKSSLVSLKDPKQIIGSSCYTSKIKYDKSSLYIRFPNCKICKIKKTSSEDAYIYVKMPPSSIKQIIRLEEVFIDIVLGNIDKWFDIHTDSAHIENYFERNIIVDTAFGILFKCKVDCKELCDKQNKPIELVLKLNNIRFLKQKYWLSWNFSSVKSVQDFPDTLFDSDLDSDVEQDEVGPDIEDIEMMVNDVRQKINNLRNVLSNGKVKLDEIEESLSTDRLILANLENYKETLNNFQNEIFILANNKHISNGNR